MFVESVEAGDRSYFSNTIIVTERTLSGFVVGSGFQYSHTGAQSQGLYRVKHDDFITVNDGCFKLGF